MPENNALARQFTLPSLMRFALPNIIMMVFLSMYTIVDGMFISRYVGTLALSAVNMTYPLNCLEMALGIMLATGGSASAAISFIKNRYNCKNIKLMNLIAAPEGVARFTSAYPDVPLYIGQLDRCLNENAYICPGLGDAGDRIFGTK